MHSCGEPYVGGLRRLVGSSVGRVVSELPIILPQRRLHLTRVVEPETLAQPVRIPYGRNGSVDAISRAERGEAKVFPIPIVIVEEADARVSRSPRSIRSKSATGSSCVRRLQDLLTILKRVITVGFVPVTVAWMTSPSARYVVLSPVSKFQ